jgi:hypothetical protein
MAPQKPGTTRDQEELDLRDIAFIVHPTSGHYILRLIVDDLSRSAAVDPEWRATVAELAQRVRDQLPQCLHIPIPEVAAAEADEAAMGRLATDLKVASW